MQCDLLTLQEFFKCACKEIGISAEALWCPMVIHKFNLENLLHVISIYRAFDLYFSIGRAYVQYVSVCLFLVEYTVNSEVCLQFLVEILDKMRYIIIFLRHLYYG